MEIGASCRLYKECSSCGLTLHYRKFPARGGGKQGPSARKSNCRSCQSRMIRSKRRGVLENHQEIIETVLTEPIAETVSMSRSAKRRRKRKAAKRRMESLKSRLLAELPAGAADAPVQAAAMSVAKIESAEMATTAAAPTKVNKTAKIAPADAGISAPAGPASVESDRKGKTVLFPEATAGYAPGALEKALRPRDGFISLKGKSDKGVRWKSPVDVETAALLVDQRAAVIVNASTIRRLFTNKSFKDYIMRRDRGICQYCGEKGDTLDHIVPKSKGGHTTPVNCVCACYACNQEKASHDAEDYREWKRGAGSSSSRLSAIGRFEHDSGEAAGIKKRKRKRRRRSRGRK